MIGPRSNGRLSRVKRLPRSLVELAIGPRRNVRNLQLAIIPQGTTFESQVSERPKALPRPRSS
jgi:hypothetical protein